MNQHRTKPSYGARAVVTGAGSGIGRSIAIELARRGGDVICADVDRDRADKAAQEINAKYPGAAHSYFCDVSVRGDVENLAAHAETVFRGPATLVVNNAGVGIGGRPVGEIGFTDWEWALGINLWGVVYGCELFMPQLRRTQPAGIINVASAAGFAAAPLMAPYNVSKAAVVSLSETIAAELNGTGITVSVLCPTFVKTNVARDGRITAQSFRLADFLMKWTGHSPARVARMTLDAHDKGRLYVLPQLDAHALWHLKRHLPRQYTWALGLMNRTLPREQAQPPVRETTGA
ncbi:SDR family NAD(P)-dependent oxidoreductase [Hoyosella subflava]|uniref:Oxidoreductase n=1 Tax=Hoyosella subflava (strain DSM 45089 / JCM 17490 / NBRC 109087 / DQS3-9A1) TaxID=443218 RepID=F6EER3_HOYSD|nr:SDR family NAD(P)-dependent oxidoreductase [Hoyosella subflava]AEF40863.1 Oxidoreductase [Hoyosella subflava DQS3-9A1]